MFQQGASILAVMCFVSLLISGCGREAETETTDRSRLESPPATSPAPASPDKGVDSVRETPARALGSTTEFETKMRTEVTKFDPLIADLESKASAAEPAAKVSLNMAIDDVKAKKRAMERRLDEFRSTPSGTDSDSRKAELEAALADLKKSYENALSVAR